MDRELEAIARNLYYVAMESVPIVDMPNETAQAVAEARMAKALDRHLNPAGRAPRRRVTEGYQPTHGTSAGSPPKGGSALGRSIGTEHDKRIRQIARDATDKLYEEMEWDARGVRWASLMQLFTDTIRTALAEGQAQREPFAEGRDHLTVSGTFQSDKYSWSGAGFVPLKITDPAARDLLAEYARRRAPIDQAFPLDLYDALERVPEKPNDRYEPFDTVQDLFAQLTVAREALGKVKDGHPWPRAISGEALAKMDENKDD